MHLNLTAFIEQFEGEANQKGLYRHQLGRSELMFLEKVWGPAFQYRFDGLKAEYPLKDLKGGQRFADFVYVKNGIRLLIEIDGFTTHARDVSPGEFEDHLTRQNDLILSGWLVLRFSSHQVEKRPQICERQLKQAIGHWWSLTYGNFSVHELDSWRLRKNHVVQMAIRRNGRIKPSEIANEFKISNHTAGAWMKRFAKEGSFSVLPAQIRNTVYLLTDFVP